MKWLAEANPEGCQGVAGGRSLLPLNDHRKTASDGRAPRRGASSILWTTPMSGKRRNDESGTPAGVLALERRFPVVV